MELHNLNMSDLVELVIWLAAAEAETENDKLKAYFSAQYDVVKEEINKRDSLNF